ncbi:tRNA (adenosine(37)-N6)-threonylcarbamoyltransferase complex dimerization subunit type 1 TsaB [candidate division WOR-1 bacterium RIFOXYA12_FULL_43_27]|uniref:tRNA (Adenosine(37)-N6)-threonylcarbamoyltransferase complex dimerization subunit type 1 TsaB n=1 Tax=candidate division WOR-1 bacterium RIFOXYC2_FULL_46_14 TaxID=1802587 RepID=A0A1F4U2W8_UNCSA|nr:MAG: tRNA (adenosine(37)-N6)-threonylcarbamoyltransferase complex dimerization subunit type 1 TsaB [candidate division WOR-1 bacterium RIFOXYA12_FULL_43_27]OGC18891.1 MAG: tRNA (adenosine(37)-N6)-threonylcarbamoyltransferase complex dimerization subunit type 1 TsaB [candidate division WOR-1 bacterium RIFOXYB2_FULL_46_45]OGC29032.1 MAG: tRNA (adenosine(37)-N6)-threonylcarbamoyltransferase complex dimerization subunit type 1 TsaB [candidate division WOR-1 bacterium RIFOXYA2_FULL_46_56]OGC39286.
MKILGISSATKTISVGLVDQDKLLAELTFSGLEAFTEDLIVYIKKIIDESGVKPECIAVTEGPGAYSGLRGGMATAKTLAQVMKIPVVGVSTLEAIAYNMIDVDGTVAAVTHAKSDDYNFALFGIANREIKRLTDDLLVSKDRLEKKLAHIKRCDGLPRGSSVAFLAQGKEKVDLLKLHPKYSHKPNIREYK